MFTPSQLKLEEEKALVSLPSGADAVQARDTVTDPEHECGFHPIARTLHPGLITV